LSGNLDPRRIVDRITRMESVFDRYGTVMTADPPRSSVPIVLASQSPRRAALLCEAGVAFEAVPPRQDEPPMEDWRFSPEEFAQSSGYFKARSVAEHYRDRIILGADTVVSLDGRMYGKPRDRDDARRILSTLAGTTHKVITGVAVYEPQTGRRLIDYDVTRITMRSLSYNELEAYLDSGEWEGKAGAYGIQDRADAFVERTDGSFSNVVGLPVELVLEMLAPFGVQPERA
jgi:septum formation protein